MLLGLSLFIFIEQHGFLIFQAVFTQLLWLVTLDVSGDNEINRMSSIWKRSFWK